MYKRLVAFFLTLLFLSGCSYGGGISQIYKETSENSFYVNKLTSLIKRGRLVEAKNFVQNASASIDAPDAEGKTLLMAAMLAQDIKSTKALLDLGANPNYLETTYKSMSPMGLAAAYKNSDFLELLINYSGNVNLYNKKDVYSPYPIFSAIDADRFNNVVFLLNRGANPNVRTVSESSPINSALNSKYSWDIVMELVKHGADLTSKNRFGEYAIQAIEKERLYTSEKYAESRKRLVLYLEERGIKLNLQIPLEMPTSSN